MEYRNLGNTEIRISRICMGCMGFGNAATGQHSWVVDEEATRQIIHMQNSNTMLPLYRIRSL